jgi:FlaA1/EpsC-like NDP-sugar epimerase
VLDMGESVRIHDLATAMIALSGLTVRDTNNPDGDIEIVEIGLRDGEKLFEELLIGDNPESTIHERIVRAQEAMLPWAQLEPMLETMRVATVAGDVPALAAGLKQLVPEYGAATEQMAKGA